MKFTRLLFFVFFLLPTFSYAACVSPAGGESQTRYDFVEHKMYYCNGTEWVGAGGGGGDGSGCTAGTLSKSLLTIDLGCGSTNISTVNATCPAAAHGEIAPCVQFAGKPTGTYQCWNGVKREVALGISTVIGVCGP